jgi:Uncharacterized conserved protein
LSQWQLLGEAPIKTDQIPFWGYYRIRATKAGFAPTDLVFGFRRTGATDAATRERSPAGDGVGARHRRDVTAPPLALPAFWMDRFEVTNRQFKEFVDAGGYRKPEYWKQPFVKDGRVLSWQQAISNSAT